MNFEFSSRDRVIILRCHGDYALKEVIIYSVRGNCEIGSECVVEDSEE